MNKTFSCSIVTPSEKVFEGAVTYASIPAWDGQRGIMTGQSPVLSRLDFGSLRLDFQEGGSRWYLIEEGFAQVAGDGLVLLTQKATPAERLSLNEATAELAEANARITKAGDDRARVERDQRRALAKKAIAQGVGDRGGAI